MSAKVYLLLKTKCGWKNKKLVTLTKGELLQSIPVDQQIENTHNDPPHNFRQCDDPNVTLAASEQDVVPLFGSEPLYLQAVDLCSARSRMYASGTLQLVTELKEGDDVSFMCEKGGIARGKIRNIGVHEDKPGIYFGIELLDEKHKKRSATSGVGNIIIVSADKLVLSNSSKSFKDGGSETTKKASDGGVTTHGRAVGKGEHSSVDQPKPGPLEKTKETFKKLWSSEPDQAPTRKHRFKVGDRVVMHSAQNFPVHGTVRWTGYLSAAKESNVDTLVMFAGIETDVPVYPATDFPDIHLDVTGSHGHARFPVEKSHGRVYLPEQVILREVSTKCQLTGASEENLVAEHISGNSMSAGELKEQQEAMRNFEEQQARKEFAKRMGEYPHHLGPGGYEEHEHELNELKRANRELQMRLREDSAPNIMGDNSYPRPPVSHFSESALAGSAAERLGQGGGGMERGSNWPISEGGHFQTYAHSASSQHVLPTSAPGHEALSQQSPRIDSGGLGVSNPVQTHGPTLHDLEVSPLNAEAFVGSVVCPKSCPDIKGVVRWVGNFPHHRGGVIAGIELFEPYEGCTDGAHRGHRYFYCSPGRALFCPIGHLQEVGRQTGGGLRNYLSHNKEWKVDAVHDGEKICKEYEESFSLKSPEPHQTDSATGAVVARRIRELEQELQDALAQLRAKDQQVRDKDLHLQLMQQEIEAERRNVQSKNELMKIAQEQLHEKDLQIRDINQDLQLAQHQVQELRSSQIQLSNQPWVIGRDELKLTEEILGTGGYGEVRVALFRGLSVAAKCLYEVIISDYNLRIFSREMTIASQLRHPNLLLFIGATTQGHPRIILTELMATSLRAELTQRPLSKQQIKSIGMDVACGLNYLHQWKPHPVIHRDISSPNVLLEPAVGNTWKAKVSDYGSANFIQQISSGSVAPGNPAYAAPEAMFPDKHTPKMDIYSFGVLLFEMSLQEQPEMSVAGRAEQAKMVQWVSLARILKDCISYQAKDRPTMAQVMEKLKPILV